MQGSHWSVFFVKTSIILGKMCGRFQQHLQYKRFQRKFLTKIMKADCLLLKNSGVKKNGSSGSPGNVI